jgi:nucleotide-binding universal stress UspA family protein
VSIVVGVDGSAGAKAALRWALAEARLRGTVLRVVHAWTFPYAATRYSILPLIDEGFNEELKKTAVSLIEEMLAEVGSEADEVEVERVTVEGAAPRVLLEQAEDAELLVVGSRGLGGFRGLLLGSVSQQCAHHAQCPVVIVPTPHGA